MPTDEARAEREERVTELKEVLESIFRDWLNEQFARFGKWTLRGIMVIFFSVFIHFMISIRSADIQVLVEHMMLDHGG